MVTGNELPEGMTPMTFEEGAAALDDERGKSADVLVIELGGRGHLGASEIVRASEMLHMAIGKLSGQQTLVLTIGGFDNDPRELHEVPDVVTFIRRVMRHAGIVHWQHSAVALFDHTSLAFLIQCGVFGTDHPWTLDKRPANLWDIRLAGNATQRGSRP